MTLKILSLSLCFLLNYTCELWQLTVFLSINIMFHFVFTMLRTFRKCQTVNDKVSLIFLFLLSFLCFTLHTWKKGLYFLFKNSLLYIDFFQVLQSSTQGIKEGGPAVPPVGIMLQCLFKFKHTSLCEKWSVPAIPLATSHANTGETFCNVFLSSSSQTSQVH